MVQNWQSLRCLIRYVPIRDARVRHWRVTAPVSCPFPARSLCIHAVLQHPRHSENSATAYRTAGFLMIRDNRPGGEAPAPNLNPGAARTLRSRFHTRRDTFTRSVCPLTSHKGDGSGVTVPVFYLTLTLSRSVCPLTKWKLL